MTKIASPISARLQKLKKALFAQGLDIHIKKGVALDMRIAPQKGPSLWKKIKTLIFQISFLKAKEQDLLSEITDIESKHRFMRQKKKLRLYAAAPISALATEEEIAFAKEKRRLRKERDMFWLFLAVVVFFNPFRRKKKVEELTPR